MASAMETQRAYAQALLVDRDALAGAQEANDVMLGHRILKAGFVADVSSSLAEARLRNGSAIDAIAVYSASNYRKMKPRSAPRRWFVVGDRLRRPLARDFNAFDRRRQQQDPAARQAPRGFTGTH